MKTLTLLHSAQFCQNDPGAIGQVNIYCWKDELSICIWQDILHTNYHKILVQ